MVSSVLFLGSILLLMGSMLLFTREIQIANTALDGWRGTTIRRRLSTRHGLRGLGGVAHVEEVGDGRGVVLHDEVLAEDGERQQAGGGNTDTQHEQQPEMSRLWHLERRRGTKQMVLDGGWLG